MGGLGLEGRTVLIIGASRGIGASAASVFAREGARLVLASRDLAALQALAASLPAGSEVEVLRADLTVEAELAAAVELAVRRFGRLDVAFNNGGVSQKRAPLAELSDATFDSAMNTNVRGVFVAMRHQIRAMLAGGGGSIVNTGSISGSVALPQMGAYCASKHALVGLTKAAALDYAAAGIRVNMVSPGPVDTLMTQQGALATPEGRRYITSITPVGRIAAPQEIAEAVAWLASPRASFVTGAILPADGGYTLP